MKFVLYSFFAFFLLAGAVCAQEIAAADRRGFDELMAIKIDIDGDGRLDTITPRTYRVNTKKGSTAERDVQNWIAFDLVTSRGQAIKSFFKYNYGTAEQGGSYWVYALKSAGDINGDGKIDLLFYTGDDTSDERVWLANRGNRFTELRRKTSTNDEW